MKSHNRAHRRTTGTRGLRLLLGSLLRSQVKWILVSGDILLVNLAALLALWLGIQRSPWWVYVSNWDSFLAWFIFLSVIWFVLSEINDLYNPRIAGRVSRAVEATFGVVLGTVLVYLVFYFLATPQSLPRHIIVFFALIAAVLMSLWRGLCARALGSTPFKRRVLLVGGSESRQVLLQAIKENAPNYYQVVDLGGGTADPVLKGAESASQLETPELVRRQVARDHIDELVLASTDQLDNELLAAVVECREQGIPVSNIATVYEQLTGRLPVEHEVDAWTLSLPWEQDSTHGLGGLLKRFLDLIFATVGLGVSATLWPLIALAIRLDSPGPILLRQRRVGKDGQLFWLLKFRTMREDAEPLGHPVWASEQDPRVTRVGRALRRLKVDEWPQFVNVLRGEMSMVGPRPERLELVKQLQEKIPFYRLRHVVKPGLTGWAAVNFRYGRSFEDALVKLQYDLYYIKHQSLYLDLLILAKTFGSILKALLD